MEAASFKMLEAEAEAKVLHVEVLHLEVKAEAEAVKNSPLPHHCVQWKHCESKLMRCSPTVRKTEGRTDGLTDQETPSYGDGRTHMKMTEE